VAAAPRRRQEKFKCDAALFPASSRCDATSWWLSSAAPISYLLAPPRRHDTAPPWGELRADREEEDVATEKNSNAMRPRGGAPIWDTDTPIPIPRYDDTAFSKNKDTPIRQVYKYTQKIRIHILRTFFTLVEPTKKNGKT
jgi:hypothetical protein